MEALIGNIEAIVLMYLPVVLAVVTQLISYITTFTKLKSIKVKEDIDASLAQTKEEMKALNSTMHRMIKDNEELREVNRVLVEKITHIEQNGGSLYD